YKTMLDAKIFEEPHHQPDPLLERVLSHTTAPVAEDALISLPTSDEVVAAQPDPRLTRKSKGPSQEIRSSHSMAVSSVSGPPLVGTSAHASTSERSVALEGSVAGGFVGKSRAEAMRRQIDPLDALAHSALSHDAEYDDYAR
ncbi:hypothetical protein Tco_0700226, partial [Tanacetum coccineum]